MNPNAFDNLKQFLGVHHHCRSVEWNETYFDTRVFAADSKISNSPELWPANRNEFWEIKIIKIKKKEFGDGQNWIKESACLHRLVKIAGGEWKKSECPKYEADETAVGGGCALHT